MIGCTLGIRILAKLGSNRAQYWGNTLNDILRRDGKDSFKFFRLTPKDRADRSENKDSTSPPESPAHKSPIPKRPIDTSLSSLDQTSSSKRPHHDPPATNAHSDTTANTSWSWTTTSQVGQVPKVYRAEKNVGKNDYRPCNPEQSTETKNDESSFAD